MKRGKSQYRRRERTAIPPVVGETHRSANGRFREFDLSLGTQPPARWPGVSACLIVRDEAQNLGPCLSSLADLPAEVIVVDTGSQDGTPEVARSLGARVFAFPWIHNFAAARNESLSHASREWIFWLDADDRLTPGAVAQLKRAAASGAADAYGCLVRSGYAEGGEEVTEHVRLFRNGLGIRFTGAIHERIIPDLMRLGLRLAHTEVTVEHVGYLSQPLLRQKAARNLPIIECQLAAHPEEVELLFYRGQARYNLGDLEGTKADMRGYLARTRPSDRFEYRRFWAYAVLAIVHQRESALEPMEALLREALAEFPRHPYLLVLLGRAYLGLSRPEDALRELMAAAAAPRTGLRGSQPAGWWVALSVAECHRALGRPAEALLWAERARQCAPDCAQAKTLLARLYLESGRVSAAEALLVEMASGATEPEPWVLLWEQHRRQGRQEEAETAMREARALGMAEQQASELEARLQAARVLAATKTRPASSPGEAQLQLQALALLSRGEYLRAAERFAEAVQMGPSNPDNYRYLALALHNLHREEEAVEAWRLAGHWAARG